MQDDSHLPRGAPCHAAVRPTSSARRLICSARRRPKSYAPSLATVRAEVNKVLENARIAREMPWTPKEVAFWKTVFPQMTNWLPEEEAAQLRSAFMEEICRLEARRLVIAPALLQPLNAGKGPLLDRRNDIARIIRVVSWSGIDTKRPTSALQRLRQLSGIS